MFIYIFSHHVVGFTFDEVIRLHLSKSKVLCCHFSSNGKLLASAGHEKKVGQQSIFKVYFRQEFIADGILLWQVSIWNMETFDSVYTSEAHKLLITDVRFKPSSTIFATSSFDKTVKVWDAARVSRYLSFNIHHYSVLFRTSIILVLIKLFRFLPHSSHIPTPFHFLLSIQCN